MEVSGRIGLLDDCYPIPPPDYWLAWLKVLNVVQRQVVPVDGTNWAILVVYREIFGLRGMEQLQMDERRRLIWEHWKRLVPRLWRIRRIRRYVFDVGSVWHALFSVLFCICDSDLSAYPLSFRLIIIITWWSLCYWCSSSLCTLSQGGNSGSPIFHEETGLAIGIHTHGGCSAKGGANTGTKIYGSSTLLGHINFLTKTCTKNSDCSDNVVCNGKRKGFCCLLMMCRLPFDLHFPTLM